MNEEDLHNTLLALTASEHPVLVADASPGSKFSETTIFQVNDNFDAQGLEQVRIRTVRLNEGL